MVVLAVHNVSKQYESNGKKALNNFSLELIEGQFLGLIGTNGAGKTTLMSILTGLQNADSGSLQILGTEIVNTIPDNIKTALGITPQDITLYDRLTVKQNLLFFAQLYNLSEKEALQRIHVQLERVGLLEKLNQTVGSLSGGMKRRINLLVSLLHKPTILLLDEPTVGIDIESRAIILELLKDLNEDGVTILFTSHHLDEAEKYCSHICFIDAGQNVLHGATQSLLQENSCANLEALYQKFLGKKIEVV